jgi:membrane protease YdiL (CAAX protease family)
MTPRERLVWIFWGSCGLRAGWRIALFIAIALGGLILASLLAFGGKQPTGAVPPLPVLFLEAMHVAAVTGATILLARIERRSFWTFGLGGDSRAKLWAAGWATGFLSLTLLLGVLRGGGYWVFDGVAQHGAFAFIDGAIWLLVFLLVAAAEEMALRGYVLATLARALGFWPAALISSGIFGLLHTHNPGESGAAIVLAFASGLMFCVLLRATGSLWAGIGFHCAWDWGQSGFYGTADSGLLVQGHVLASHAAGNPLLSGGTAGPEGSLLAAPVFIGGVLLLAAGLRRRGGSPDDMAGSPNP